MTTVYPPEGAVPEVRKWLEEHHPQALIVFHPVFKRWLMFEAPKGSTWTAQRLAEAMAEHHAHAKNTGIVGTPKWATDRGAPIMRGELKAPPGSWMFKWLNENDLWKRGHREWLEEIEKDEALEEKHASKIHDDIVYEATHETMMPHHMADALRGDTIKRKWRTNAPELKKEETKPDGSGKGTI